MKHEIAGLRLSLMVVMFAWAVAAIAQQTAAPATSAATASSSANTVPQLVNYGGTLTDVNGKPLAGVAGVTFSLYQDSQSVAPLWMETQSVQADKSGRYSVMLGSTTSQGLPQSVFVTGEARWLGVRIEGQEEQPRVLLVAVPYALKAADAETISGLPASAFVLANSAEPGKSQNRSTKPGSAGTLNVGKALPPPNPAVTGAGTSGNIPMWDSASDIINSIMVQKTSLIGVGTTAPAALLDVNGKSDIRDTLTLFPKTTDNTLAVSGTAFKVSNTGAVTFISGQTFPGTGTITGITTASGSGLSGGATSGAPSLSLLKTCATGQTLGWNGTAWACATSSGGGTITGVTAGTGLAGGGTTGKVTLSIATKACAKGQALTGLPLTCTAFATTGANTFTGNQTVNGEVNIAGSLRAEDASFTTDVVASGEVSGATAKFTGAVATGTQTVTGNVTVAGDITAMGSTSLITGVAGNFAASNATQVLGVTQSGSGSGIVAKSTTGEALDATSSDGIAIAGTSTASSDGVGVGGTASGTGSVGVNGISTGGRGVQGNSDTLGGVVGMSTTGDGLAGVTCTGCSGPAGVVGIGKLAGSFTGNVGVSGDFAVTGVKAFHIDHPLDPANRFLNHFAIESNEVLNTYSGNVTTDASGDALVELPEYFEALNTNYRYQLTVVGQFAQAIIFREIQNNNFVIKTDMPSVKVSWQVTGVRSDANLKAHPVPVEEEKTAQERGYYLTPEAFGQPEEKGLAWLYHPDLMRDAKAIEVKRKAKGGQGQ